jgi:hypothetical protein
MSWSVGIIICPSIYLILGQESYVTEIRSWPYAQSGNASAAPRFDLQSSVDADPSIIKVCGENGTCDCDKSLETPEKVCNDM